MQKMDANDAKQANELIFAATAGARLMDFDALSRTILRAADSDVSLVDFLREIAFQILDTSACDAVELHVQREVQQYHCEAIRGAAEPEFKCTLRRDADEAAGIAAHHRGDEQHPRTGTSRILRGSAYRLSQPTTGSAVSF